MHDKKEIERRNLTNLKSIDLYHVFIISYMDVFHRTCIFVSDQYNRDQYLESI
jgi:hypothetical protein